MKNKNYIRIYLSVLMIISAALLAFPAMDESGQGEPEFYLFAHIGLGSYAVTETPQEKLPFPVEAGFEYMVTNRFGIGGFITYDRWKDILGMYGGRYIFHMVRPSLDVLYHLTPRTGLVDVFSGARLGYTFVSVSNELGNPYMGSLNSEIYIGPFLGARLRILKPGSSPLKRIDLDFRLSWSVFGDFSGLNGSAGLTFGFR